MVGVAANPHDVIVFDGDDDPACRGADSAVAGALHTVTLRARPAGRLYSARSICER